MSKRIWHDGPPPHVGWWNASLSQRNDGWRWWDGESWSWSAGRKWSWTEILDSLAHRVPPEMDLVQWTDYYPDNARVPRIDPTTTLEVRADRVADWARKEWVGFFRRQKLHPSTPVIVTIQLQVQI